jgi:hypothetical protein
VKLIIRVSGLLCLEKMMAQLVGIVTKNWAPQTTTKEVKDVEEIIISSHWYQF